MNLRVKSKMTMREIAAHFGISVSTAWSDIRTGIREEMADMLDLAETERGIQTHQLDEWQNRTISALGENDDPDVVAKLLGLALKISERKSKLLGLDAPVKQEVTGRDGGPLNGPVIYIPPESSD